MLQTLRDIFTPEQRRVIGNEARQSLEDKHWKQAFEAVEAHLIEKGKSCDVDAKHGPEKSARILTSLQLLEALKRELHRKVQDGEFAQIELNEIERKTKPLRFIR
jgi:hypothetical protein